MTKPVSDGSSSSSKRRDTLRNLHGEISTFSVRKVYLVVLAADATDASVTDPLLLSDNYQPGYASACITLGTGSGSNGPSTIRPTASTSSAPIQATADTALQAPEATSTTSSTSISYSHRRTSAAVRNSLIPRANPSFASAGDSPWVPAAAVQPHQQYNSNTHPAEYCTHGLSSIAWERQRNASCLGVLPTVLEHSNPSCLPTFGTSSSPQTTVEIAIRLQDTMKMACGPALTVRALAAGLGVGAVLCFSNMYFGLQTGWVTMGSLQSAILGESQTMSSHLHVVKKAPYAQAISLQCMTCAL